MLIIGTSIVQGFHKALWIGFGVFTLAFLASFLGATGTVVYSGVFGDERLRIGILSLLCNLSLIGAILNGDALVARFVADEQ